MNKPIPDYFAALTTWRVWRALEDGQLRGLNGQLWYGFVPNKAFCTNGSRTRHIDNSPDWDCTCGIWSFKTLPLTIDAFTPQLMEPWRQQGRPGVTVVGTTHIWGHTIETELGYRSEYSYPKGVILSPQTPYFDRLQQRIAKRYGIEVQVSEIVDQYIDLKRQEGRF